MGRPEAKQRANALIQEGIDQVCSTYPVIFSRVTCMLHNIGTLHVYSSGMCTAVALIQAGIA
jgi:hypothetical protein